jgi:hypothetical protein
MDTIDISDPAVLATQHFASLAIAQQVISRSAARLGFGLHLSSSSKQPDVRFHCYKGGKQSKARHENICGCSDRLNRARDFSYHFGRCEGEHDHELFPAAFADLLLSDDRRDYVQEWCRIGVALLTIQWALQARGRQPSSVQIHNRRRSRCLQAFTDSSAELINWVLIHGGACHTCDERFYHDVARVTVFIQMNGERHLREELGDVREIDGTQPLQRRIGKSCRSP